MGAEGTVSQGESCAEVANGRYGMLAVTGIRGNVVHSQIRPGAMNGRAETRSALRLERSVLGDGKIPPEWKAVA